MTEYIDKAQLIKAHWDLCTGDCGICPDQEKDGSCGLIKNFPTVDPIRHGHWIPRSEMVREPLGKNYDCSVCGVNNIQYNYCPNCGAKMDEENL